MTSREVAACLRCFELALELQPRLTTLLTERGCLAYQLHSYAARIVKKVIHLEQQKMLGFFPSCSVISCDLFSQSVERPFQEAHLRVCIHWRRRMLHLAYRSYGQALRLERRRSAYLEASQPPLPVANEAASPSSTSTSNSLFSGSIGSSPLGGQVDEEWLYHYMLTKCEEKAGPGGLFREVKAKKHHEEGG